MRRREFYEDKSYEFWINDFDDYGDDEDGRVTASSTLPLSYSLE